MESRNCHPHHRPPECKNTFIVHFPEETKLKFASNYSSKPFTYSQHLENFTFPLSWETVFCGHLHTRALHKEPFDLRDISGAEYFNYFTFFCRRICVSPSAYNISRRRRLLLQGISLQITLNVETEKDA